MNKYMLIPITHMNQKQFIEGPCGKYGRGIFLSSNYIWCDRLNMQISQLVKQHDSGNITVHGGPSTPSYEAACQEFMVSNPSVDIAVHGEGELTILDLLIALDGRPDNFEALSNVNGITYRQRSKNPGEPPLSQTIRTDARERVRDLDTIPSPYLSGVFDSYGGNVESAMIESNRGCPYGCTFCDWGSATNQKVRKFDLQRVKDEVEWIGKNQVRVILIADANYGIYDRDIELANWIWEVKRRYCYPREVVVNYAKNATKRLAQIVEVFSRNNICSQGIISIQTRDVETLEVIDRKNIKSERYNELSDIFRSQGLPLSTDLMIGLPGISTQSFTDDLQYYFDKDVMVKAYPTQLLPNSPMADPEYMEKYRIKTDEDQYLTSCFSYSESDLEAMKRIYSNFVIAENFGILRYVLRYLQWEHNVSALTFLSTFSRTVRNNPGRYPSSYYILEHFQQNMVMPGGWHQFYEEVSCFSSEAFSVNASSGFNAVLLFNELVMPDDSLEYPIRGAMGHDVIAYLRDNNHNPRPDLKVIESYPEVEYSIEDKYQYSLIDYSKEQYDTHQIFWKLPTAASRHQSEPNFR